MGMCTCYGICEPSGELCITCHYGFQGFNSGCQSYMESTFIHQTIWIKRHKIFRHVNLKKIYVYTIMSHAGKIKYIQIVKLNKPWPLDP